MTQPNPDDLKLAAEMMCCYGPCLRDPLDCRAMKMFSFSANELLVALVKARIARRLTRRARRGSFPDPAKDLRDVADLAPMAYTVAEAAIVAKSSRTSVYLALARGDLRAVKRGRKTLIFARELQRWVASLVPYRSRPNGRPGGQ